MTHNKKIGDLGETLAQDFLIKKGYKMVEINARIGNKEIDIISLKKKQYIFIEVKTRTNSGFQLADDAISQKKLQYLKKAMVIYCHINKISVENTRFDLIAVNLAKNSSEINHYKGIF